MEKLRFRTAAELVENQTLRQWHVSGYVALYADLKKKSVDSTLLQTVENWLYSSTWRGTSILLWLVDEEKHQIVGTAQSSVIDTPVPKVQVNEVIVLKSYRREGHGERLVKELMERSIRQWPKADRLELTSNPSRMAARATYVRLGFSRRDTDVFTFFCQKPTADG